MTLPIGFVYTETDTVVLDPDLQVQASVHEVFRSFAHTGSAFTTVRHFRQQQLLFPCRLRRGAHRGELVWAEIEHHDVLRPLDPLQGLAAPVIASRDRELQLYVALA
ncbi:hypothetical protein [Dictyobacter aurantiacus]|uniref:hypothetical protein n=1 Tax=Dictyobacter aurantiacus TaxID=1936993 RepID=UPI000F83964A|nr:hypothetical protein [Dictyobacter aurantiacus]